VATSLKYNNYKRDDILGIKGGLYAFTSVILSAKFMSCFLAPDPHRGSAPGPCWGTSVPQTSSALPLPPNLWLLATSLILCHLYVASSARSNRRRPKDVVRRRLTDLCMWQWQNIICSKRTTAVGFFVSRCWQFTLTNWEQDWGMSWADKNGRENLGRNVRIGKIFRGRCPGIDTEYYTLIWYTHTCFFTFTFYKSCCGGPKGRHSLSIIQLGPTFYMSV